MSTKVISRESYDFDNNYYWDNLVWVGAITAGIAQIPLSAYSIKNELGNKVFIPSIIAFSLLGLYTQINPKYEYVPAFANDDDKQCLKNAIEKKLSCATNFTIDDRSAIDVSIKFDSPVSVNCVQAVVENNPNIRSYNDEIYTISVKQQYYRGPILFKFSHDNTYPASEYVNKAYQACSASIPAGNILNISQSQFLEEYIAERKFKNACLEKAIAKLPSCESQIRSIYTVFKRVDASCAQDLFHDGLSTKYELFKFSTPDNWQSPILIYGINESNDHLLSNPEFLPTSEQLNKLFNDCMVEGFDSSTAGKVTQNQEDFEL